MLQQLGNGGKLLTWAAVACSGHHRFLLLPSCTSVRRLVSSTAACLLAPPQVVEINGQRILLAAVDGSVKAVSNKCSHLGLPLVGKTRKPGRGLVRGSPLGAPNTKASPTR